LDVANPEQFSLSVPGFEFDSMWDEEERAALMRAGNWNIDTVDIGKIEVINPHTKYRFAIDHVRISGMRFRRSQLVDLGVWSIASDPLDVKTEASRRWPESVTARRLVAVLRRGFFVNLKEDFALTLEVEGADDALQYHGECADGKLVVDDNGRRMMVEYDDYAPADYFENPRELPLRHVTFRATRPVTEMGDGDVALESGGQFQLGETVFQMTDPTIDPAMRLLRGETRWEERAVRIQLTSDSALLTRLYPQLWIDEQPATLEQWSAIVYARAPEELSAEERAVVDEAMTRTAEPDPSDPEFELPAEMEVE
jgi:hypothetical protein